MHIGPTLYKCPLYLWRIISCPCPLVLVVKNDHTSLEYHVFLATAISSGWLRDCKKLCPDDVI